MAATSDRRAGEPVATPVVVADVDVEPHDAAEPSRDHRVLETRAGHVADRAALEAATVVAQVDPSDAACVPQDIGPGERVGAGLVRHATGQRCRERRRIVTVTGLGDRGHCECANDAQTCDELTHCETTLSLMVETIAHRYRSRF